MMLFNGLQYTKLEPLENWGPCAFARVAHPKGMALPVTWRRPLEVEALSVYRSMSVTGGAAALAKLFFWARSWPIGIMANIIEFFHIFYKFSSQEKQLEIKWETMYWNSQKNSETWGSPNSVENFFVSTRCLKITTYTQSGDVVCTQFRYI